MINQQSIAGFHFLADRNRNGKLQSLSWPQQQQQPWTSIRTSVSKYGGRAPLRVALQTRCVVEHSTNMGDGLVVHMMVFPGSVASAPLKLKLAVGSAVRWLRFVHRVRVPPRGQPLVRALCAGELVFPCVYARACGAGSTWRTRSWRVGRCTRPLTRWWVSWGTCGPLHRRQASQVGSGGVGLMSVLPVRELFLCVLGCM